MSPKPEDEGFEALLKPIQDLTRNWEVDLCLHLEEYINYIRQICGDNIPDMNFAQAAVLVQNSANIYSKKVDFLFTTVVQLLDTLSKKQNEAKHKDGQGEDPDNPGAKRRRAVAVLETEEFVCFDEVCSDRTLTLNLEKEKAAEKKKSKVVLNAAVKVKAKEKTSCNVYQSGQDIMGKKEEFRLNWRICSGGTLHEEFVISKDRFKTMEPVEVTVIEGDIEDVASIGHCSHYSEDLEPPQLEEGLILSVVNPILPSMPIDRESNVEMLGNTRGRKIENNVVNARELEWQPNDINANLPDNPIKKKKVVKIPKGLDEKKRKVVGGLILPFTITDEFIRKYNHTNFNRDLDFALKYNNAAKLKRQLLRAHRAKYQEYWERESGLDQIEDFPGFYNEGQDSDNENDFEGFDNGCSFAPEVDVPLPDNQNVLEPFNCDPDWKGDDDNTYDNAVQKTMLAYHSSRKFDYDKKTDLARRVEEWHQKILPKLEAATKRSSFDIHAYGSKILEAFGGEIGCVRSFAEIVVGLSREEVARYFLAVLMLANPGNIEITKSEPGDLVVDCMQLKLLSTTRHHEELDDNMRQTSDKKP